MRYLAFFLALLLPVSVWGRSYTLTEEQLTALELNLNQQIRLLSEAEKELSLLSEKLKQSEQRLELSGKELEQSKADLEKSQTSLQTASESLSQLEQSQWIKIGLATGAGVLAGAMLGFLYGITY